MQLYILLENILNLNVYMKFLWVISGELVKRRVFGKYGHIRPPNLKGYHITLFDDWGKIRIYLCQNIYLPLNITSKFCLSDQPIA